MRVFILLLAFLPIASQAIEAITENTRCHDVTTDMNGYTSCLEEIDAYWLNSTDSVIKRTNKDTLEIKLQSGEIKSYINSPAPWTSFEDNEGKENAYYLAAAIFSNTNYVLISVHFWEGNGFLLSNLKTGEETYVDGGAKISPNRKNFVFYSDDAMESASYVKIFKITDSGISQEFKHEPEFDIYSASWLSESKLEIFGVNKQSIGHIENTSGEWALLR